jgi:hypothetical protein
VTSNLELPFGADSPGPAADDDRVARQAAVDPSRNVALAASAGTGKTRVLVERYVRLVESGVDPRNILAMTFTRKAAAEMRERVLTALARQSATSVVMAERWNGLRDRIADIQISTIDAFCFGLLREFPIEADVDPVFEIADETEMARFATEALDLTFRTTRSLVTTDEQVRLLLARVKAPLLRDAIAALLDRRDDDPGELARPVNCRCFPTVLQHGDDVITGPQAEIVECGDDGRYPRIPLRVGQPQLGVHDRHSARIACHTGDETGTEIKHLSSLHDDGLPAGLRHRERRG